MNYDAFQTDSISVYVDRIDDDHRFHSQIDYVGWIFHYGRIFNGYSVFGYTTFLNTSYSRKWNLEFCTVDAQKHKMRR